MDRLNLIDYTISARLFRKDIPFYALIAGAMRKASSENITKLREMFPGIYDDLLARYNARGSVLPDDKFGDLDEALEKAEKIANGYLND